MKTLSLFSFYVLLSLFWSVHGQCENLNCLNINPLTDAQASMIAEKIWKNECSKKMEYLTCWNEGEEFASLGIGHFIWYPENQPKVFKEAFPAMIAYLSRQNISVPKWLCTAKHCPWSSREAFYREIQSTQMSDLRQFLYDTRKHQAQFIAAQLKSSFPTMLVNLSPEEKQKVTTLFYQLFSEKKGFYALLDYSHFKGMGTEKSEKYQGQGWGLQQVLLAIPEPNDDLLEAFIQTAKKVLAERVKNSPSERGEQRWLKGWTNRIDTYRNF